MPIELVRQGEFLLLQFNCGCDEALPACQAMCCRMRKYYSVELTAEEQGRFLWHEWEGKKVLEGKPNGDCYYLEGDRCGVYDGRPQGCKEFHCSPRGGESDPLITRRDQGWALFPARVTQ